MRASYKFKPGAGAILAFLILFVVFASVVGVVFVALNGQPLKSSAASYNVCDFNKDGAVNNGDLDLLSANMQNVPQSLTDDQKKYDVNGDGELNSGDLLVVRTNNPNYCVPKEVIVTRAPDAPVNAVCSGSWRTIKDLGKYSPEAVVGVGGKLVFVDASPQPSSTEIPHLVAREISINDSNGNTAEDTDWYSVDFLDTQPSMVLIPTPGAVAPADIYLYGEVSGQRKVYQGSWSGEKNWTGFKVVSDANEIGGSLGRTGPDSVMVGNRAYRFLTAYEGYEWNTISPNSYLQICDQTISRTACWFYPKNAIAGKTLTLFGEYTGSQPVYIVPLNGGTSGGVNIGNINSRDGNRDYHTWPIPTTVAAGSYNVRIGVPGVNAPQTTCLHASGDRVLNVSSAAKPNRCDFNSDGKVDRGDQELLGKDYFTKDPGKIKVYDLNGDKRINSGDQAALAHAVRVYPTATKFCY